MVWKRTFYGNVDLSTTCQCRQFRLNPLSTQINIYCLMTNQKPALLVQRAPWTRAAMMLLQSLYFSRFLPNRPRPLSSFDTHARWQPVTQSARSRRSYGKIEDCEQSIISVAVQTLVARLTWIRTQICIISLIILVSAESTFLITFKMSEKYCSFSLSIKILKTSGSRIRYSILMSLNDMGPRQNKTKLFCVE